MKKIAMILLLIIWSCTTDQTKHSRQTGWQLVYKHDLNGNAIYGNKSDLISAVRNGYSIRVGWGTKRTSDSTQTIEHLANVEFLTILNNEEVFAQISQIIGQRPFFEQDSLKVKFRESNAWTRIIGTNGYSTGLMTNFIADSLVNHGNDRKAGGSWFVDNKVKNRGNGPLWEYKK